MMGESCKRTCCWSYQGLLRLWGAWRAVRGGGTAPVTGIGHVPICQGLKRRQSVLIHRDAVQGLCKHCQQVGLIFFIYLLRRGKGGKTETEKNREMGKIGHFSQEKLHLSFFFSSREVKVVGGCMQAFIVNRVGRFFFFFFFFFAAELALFWQAF